MAIAPTFDRVEEKPEDAVTVILTQAAGVTLGEVWWPFHLTSDAIGVPVLGDPQKPEIAFRKAFDKQRRLGLPRVVVLLSEGAIWDPEWGTLNG